MKRKSWSRLHYCGLTEYGLGGHFSHCRLVADEDINLLAFFFTGSIGLLFWHWSFGLQLTPWRPRKETT